MENSFGLASSHIQGGYLSVNQCPFGHGVPGQITESGKVPKSTL